MKEDTNSDITRMVKRTWNYIGYVALLPHISALAGALVAAGSKVGSAILGALTTLLKTIPVPATLSREPPDISDTRNIYKDNILIATITITEQGPGYEVGLVVLHNDLVDQDDDVIYQYRYYEGAYWVWSDEEEEWVKQDEGWVPGNIPKLP